MLLNSPGLQGLILCCFERAETCRKRDKLMQVRRFSPDRRVKIPGNHPGLYGVMIQMNRAEIPPEQQEEVARRFNGLPLLMEAGFQVEVMYFDPQASMEEHAGEYPILFLVIQGYGTVRIGGPGGETCKVQAGDAVLWPAHTDHTVWTEDQELHAIVINAFQDKASR
jgi:quercetin dioxygenase-like cupin family protein